MTIKVWLDNAVQDAERRGLAGAAAAARVARAGDVGAADGRLERRRDGRIARLALLHGTGCPLSRARSRSWRGRSAHVTSPRRRSPTSASRSSPSAIRRSTPSSRCSPTRRAQQAREADDEIAAGRYRGPLHGVPISLKDLIDLEGMPTTAASRVRDGHVAAADATVVTRLREAGRGLHRQDQPARVRARHHQRGLGLRAGAPSARSRAVAGRIVRRIGRVGAGRDGVRVDRHRHRRIDSHPVGGVRPRRAEADARRDPHRRASSR